MTGGAEVRSHAYACPASPPLCVQVAASLGVAPVSLDELYARADYITLHAPNTPETKGLLRKDTLAR